MSKPTLANLTLAERLIVSRHRSRKTQRDVAQELLLPRRTVQELEAGTFEGEVPDRVLAFADLKGELRDNERCIVARLRSGKKIGEVAEEWGKSRQWLNELESGREQNVTPLLQFWQI